MPSLVSARQDGLGPRRWHGEKVQQGDGRAQPSKKRWDPGVGDSLGGSRDPDVEAAGGYRTRMLAEIAQREKEDELFSGGGVKPIAWGDFVSKYVRRLEAEGRHETVRDYRYILARFGEMRSPARPDTVSRDMVIEHRAELSKSGLRPATVRKALATIKAALSAAVDYGHARENPLRGFRGLMPKIGARVKRQLTDEDISLLVAAAPDEMMEVVIQTAWRTGLRVGKLRTSAGRTLISTGRRRWSGWSAGGAKRRRPERVGR